jgi:hypothetical protein
MEPQIKEIEFSKLRHAYVTIKSYIELRKKLKIDKLKTRIAGDLSLLGDDNYELIEDFVSKFELDHKDFLYERHFYSEYELFGSESALINLLTLSVWLPMKTIELLTFNKIILDKPDFYKPERAVKDLTFKDLLTWYIEGRFATEKEITYKLK